MKQLVYLLIAIIATVSVIADITGDEIMGRGVPEDRVEAGTSFDIFYFVSSATPPWGASIVDTVSGGCTFPNGEATFQTVMLSDSGDILTISMMAPEELTTCVFSGDYKFGNLPIEEFPDQSVLNFIFIDGDGGFVPSIGANIPGLVDLDFDEPKTGIIIIIAIGVGAFIFRKQLGF